jgi:dCTP deaminase
MAEKSVGLFPELGTGNEQDYTTGVLPSQFIRTLIMADKIRSKEEISAEQIQPASLDLRLGSVAYRVRASFLPGKGRTVEDRIRDLLIGELDLTKPAIFEKGCVFIAPVLEEMSLPADISAQANPKSTTGRLDIFTRLITDYGAEFECIPRGYKGKLYVEIVSRTFPVILAAGTRLNQVRFVRGNPPSRDSKLIELDERETLVFEDSENPGSATIDRGLRISVDLQGDGSSDVIAYMGRQNAPAIDLGRENYYDWREFWDPVHKPISKTIILNPGDFYLLASKERIRIPPAYAAEMVPFDPSMGEFRVHYAGFFDPGFGYGSSDISGTRAVLEVRAHEVPIVLEDSQMVGRLVYSRMTAKPDKIYGPEIGSSYQQQGLAFSRQFKRTS